MGYGNVFASGIIGALGGAAVAAGKNAENEQKLEMERIREERLSKLRTQEYQARADIDISNIPKKGTAETDVLAKREEALREGKVETKAAETEVETKAVEARARSGKELQDEYASSDARREGIIAGAKREAEAPYTMSEIKARGDESIRVAIASDREAAKHKWTPDADGYYVDANGDRVTRSERIEGRTVTLPVMAPKTKVEGRDANWVDKEELDSLNKQIEKATSDPLADEGKVAKLREEKRQLMARMGGKGAALASPAPAGKPWERKWGAN